MDMDFVMNDLIESLQIFCKYFNGAEYAPTHCEHDILQLVAANEENMVSDVDKARLEELGWHYSNHYGCWCSWRFGSC